MPDEDLLGDDEELPPPSRWRPVVWGALALALLAIGSVLVGRNTTVASFSADLDNTAPFGPVVSRPLPTEGLALGLAENLLVGVSCPTLEGAPGLIAVSFRLVNWGQSNSVVTEVRLAGSLHGLKLRDLSSGGSCDQPGHGPVGGSLPPGEGQLYTLWFTTPAGCPGSLKTVFVDVRAESLTGTTTTAVTRDAGRVYLTTCPVTAPAT